ncbi:uncharacterized protein LOC100570504 [Acyrthosiphon pisum]|uniref:Uncharacterized protein n=1 Tax=Acyrthosiphon pisum TaxID=7029 RepID=A0A8R2A8P2_ACYPI|nr:uncharacterized protein LOC100570504 [Acyrthosiphon pisum]|eukprot:XP_003246770.1 PREDICTED: uncharacterized protein LOC100570504 [Acyrthosiphon pisum]
MPKKRQDIGRRTNKARRKRARRMKESEEENKRRVESVRLQQSQSRSNEMVEPHEAQIALTRSNFSYAGLNLECENNRLQIEKLEPIGLQCIPDIDYFLYPAASKNKVRTHRQALKFKDEPPEIFCLNGKVKSPVLNPRPELLNTAEAE